MGSSLPVAIASNQSSVPMIQYPIGSGGVSVHEGNFTGNTAVVNITTGPAQVYGWYFYNTNGYPAYVHFYDIVTATTINVATTDPKYCLPIPPAGGANVFGIGIPHLNSIRIAISTARKGVTLLSSGVEYNIFYKQ